MMGGRNLNEGRWYARQLWNTVVGKDPTGFHVHVGCVRITGLPTMNLFSIYRIKMWFYKVCISSVLLLLLLLLIIIIIIIIIILLCVYLRRCIWKSTLVKYSFASDPHVLSPSFSSYLSEKYKILQPTEGLKYLNDRMIRNLNFPWSFHAFSVRVTMK
jgi:hypothetical protein